MKKLLLALSLLIAPAAYAGTCAGPGPCVPGNEPTGPAELCLPDGCTPVVYSWHGDMVIAEGTLVNGYPVIGWAGPCGSSCPNIFVQAFEDAKINALRAVRARRY